MITDGFGRAFGELGNISENENINSDISNRARKINKVTVLAGGKSPEREVSLKSGKRVSEALCGLGYRVALLDPVRDYSLAKECFFESFTQIAAFEAQSGGCACENGDGYALTRGNSPEITASVLEICKRSDAVFLALHGGAGEDGTLQAVLEAYSIPHTGSGVLGCAVAMDKLISKRLLEDAGILTPPYTVFRASETVCSDTGRIRHSRVARAPDFPCVVKPLGLGSSIGVKMASTPTELAEYAEIAASFGGDVLIERKICGREFTVGVLDGRALSVTEIKPLDGFYDYENKYVGGRTKEITPAEIPSELETRLKRIAVRSHAALSLGSCSRVDIIVSADSGLPYVLEANALPGMTSLSLLPQGAAASGIPFDVLCERILWGAVGISGRI